MSVRHAENLLALLSLLYKIAIQSIAYAKQNDNVSLQGYLPPILLGCANVDPVHKQVVVLPSWTPYGT
jgi:hypothetical protein